MAPVGLMALAAHWICGSSALRALVASTVPPVAFRPGVQGPSVSRPGTTKNVDLDPRPYPALERVQRLRNVLRDEVVPVVRHYDVQRQGVAGVR